MKSQLLKSIPGIIEKTFPIPARFRSKLPRDIAELSRLLTSSRGERSLSYLNRPNLLSAYLHYFLPWNLYRLCLLLPSLDFSLSDGDSIIDLGSGTLTFVSALWIARPDLRDLKLEFFCVDRSRQAMEAGKKLFFALAGDCPWKIYLVREEINFVHGLHESLAKRSSLARINKAKLICAVNLFNELYEKVSHNDKEELKKAAISAAQFMCKHTIEGASILTVEPGVPQSGRFISFLREAFLSLGHAPLAPCTHSAACPLTNSGKNRKWCHFAHEEFDPPRELAKLSAAAKLPKERLVYSYLFTEFQREGCKERKENSIRVISDSFSLPGDRFGCYCCSEKGLVLLRGSKDHIDKTVSGKLITGKLTNELDEKSGAVIMEVQ